MIGCGAILLLIFGFFGLGSVSTFATLATTASMSASAVDLNVYADLPQSRTEDGGFVLGDAEAPITLVVFADWSCPACQAYKPTVDEFIDRYVRTGQAKLESRVIMTHGGATTGYASQLAECAEEQRPGAYWQAYELLYDYGSQGFDVYNESMARPFSEALSLDLSQLLSCVPGAEQVDNDAMLATEAGVNATPGLLFRLNDGDPQLLPGGREIQDLAQLVESAQ
jgi:protein-disulfide isomerase